MSNATETALTALSAKFTAAVRDAGANVECTVSRNARWGLFLIVEGEGEGLAAMRTYLAALPELTHSEHTPADADGPASDRYSIT